MNIFYLHQNTKVCAEMHVDKHCVKMILEYAQLLSTAHRVLDGNQSIGVSKTGRKQTRYVLPNSLESVLYGATHINHPSAVWVRQSKENYDWLAAMLLDLCKEYTYRYDKIHKCEQIGLVEVLSNAPKNISNNSFTEPTPAMPDDVKVEKNSINSYRNYYIKHKTHLASWKKRDTPKWYAESTICQPTY
jgi:disulfide oxidoreductase YuzD